MQPPVSATVYSTPKAQDTQDRGVRVYNSAKLQHSLGISDTYVSLYMQKTLRIEFLL